MKMSKKCCVDGCNQPVHAKGYCRRHYGQVWRKGCIGHNSDSLSGRFMSGNDSDRQRALERELRKAQNMYRQVVGFEGRLKWRKEIEAVKKEIARISELEEVKV